MVFKLPALKQRLHSLRAVRLPDLGKRELLVLEVLWANDDCTAQYIQSQMPDEGISLSTVQSTLERLHRKRLVQREKIGRAFCYRAGIERSQLISALLHDMTQQVAAGDLAPVISGFLDFVASEAPELASHLSESLRAPDAQTKNTPSQGDD